MLSLAAPTTVAFLRLSTRCSGRSPFVRSINGGSKRDGGVTPNPWWKGVYPCVGCADCFLRSRSPRSAANRARRPWIRFYARACPLRRRAMWDHCQAALPELRPAHQSRRRFALRAAERQLQLQRRTVDSGSSTPSAAPPPAAAIPAARLRRTANARVPGADLSSPHLPGPGLPSAGRHGAAATSSPPPNSPPYTPPGGGWAPTSSVNGPPTTSLYNRETMQRELRRWAKPRGPVYSRTPPPTCRRTKVLRRRTRARSGRKIIANAHGRSDPGCARHAHDRAGFL